MIKGFITYFQSLFIKNKDFVLIAALFFLCSIFYVLFPAQYKYLLSLYMMSLMQGASLLLSVFHIKHLFDSSTLSFMFDSFAFTPDTSFAALKYSFMSITLPLIFLRLSAREKLLFVISSVFFVYLLNCTRIFFVLSFISSNHQIPGPKHDLAFHAFLLALPLGAYIWQTKSGWSDFFGKNTNPNITFLHKIAALLMIYSFLRYFYYFSIGWFMKSNWIFDSLTLVILSLGKIILSQFSYFVTVQGRILSDAGNSIYMGDPCVGLNIMIVFMIVVFISRGKILHKVLFALSGLLAIIILNSIRVTILFAYLKETASSQLAFQDLHRDYNTVIYIFVFLLWVGWFYLQKKLNKPHIHE